MNQKHSGLDIFVIVLIIVYNLALQLFAVSWLFTNCYSTIKSRLTNIAVFEINESVTYGLFLSGVLGGTFYCLRAVYQRLGEAYTPIDNKPIEPARVFNARVWLFWFLYRPIQGGILALIILSLVNSNLLSIKQMNPETMKPYYAQVAIGFLAGFGSHELIHKIQELISVLFAKAKVGSTSSEDKVKENSGK